MSAANAASNSKKIGKYEIGRVLGKGNFSKVRLATDTTNGERYAIKIIDKALLARDHLEDQIRREISIMKVLRHKYIVQMREAFQTTKHMYVVMELVEGGELFDMVADQGRLPEDVARKYFQQLLVSVRYCHANKIAHRDLKLENLLLDSKGNLKVSDFGLANMQVTPDASVLRTVCGTPNYVAPEVIKMNSQPRNASGERVGGYNGFTADVWSCGVILFIMLSGRQAFDDDDLRALFNKIERGQYQMSRHIPEGAKPLLEKILNVDANARYTIDDIIAHPWFQKNFDPAELNAGGSATINVDDAAMRNAVEDVADNQLSPALKSGIGGSNASGGALGNSSSLSTLQAEQRPRALQPAQLSPGDSQIAGVSSSSSSTSPLSPARGGGSSGSGMDGFQLANALIASALSASPFVDVAGNGAGGVGKAGGAAPPAALASPVRRPAASGPPVSSAFAAFGGVRQYLVRLSVPHAQAAVADWLKSVLPSALRNPGGGAASPAGAGSPNGGGGGGPQMELRGFITTPRGIMTWVMEVLPTAAAGLSVVQARKGMGDNADFLEVLKTFARKMADAKVLASELNSPPPGTEGYVASPPTSQNASPKSVGSLPLSSSSSPSLSGGLGGSALPAITSQRKVMATPGGLK